MKKDSFYDILQVKSDASQEEIKVSYQKLILTNHPDKSTATDAADNFRVILNAWRVLGSIPDRAAYDKDLLQLKMSNSFGEEIPLSDFTGPLEDGFYERDCRCGGTYEVSIDELEDGSPTVQCTDCSLRVTVIQIH